MGILRDVTARKQSEEALRRSEERLARAQRIDRIGSWEWDIDTNEVAWSDECDRLFGLPPGAGKMTYEQFFSFVHPDDHTEVDEAVRRALGGSLSFSIHHRTLAHDGREQGLEHLPEEELAFLERPLRAALLGHVPHGRAEPDRVPRFVADHVAIRVARPGRRSRSARRRAAGRSWWRCATRGRGSRPRTCGPCSSGFSGGARTAARSRGSGSGFTSCGGSWRRTEGGSSPRACQARARRSRFPCLS
ncbi:hypothetical protein E8A74_48660 [Polyangium fumosum]|uniref:histidine kinase n=1 Tax=Polyangium fumosum TaxID=889272 RepID=A0A4U1IJP9_9BACT|nr:hypothetical protein E8A74_48660 [Polyangium fumosum]